MSAPLRQAHLASLLCDEELLQHDDPAEPVDVTVIAAGSNAAAPTDDGLPEPRALRVELDRLDEDETLRLWQQRAIRAEAELAVRQTDAYWERYVGNEAIARATADEDKLKSRLATRERERDAAREAARAIQRSTSWRLTAPLRLAKRLAPSPPAALPGAPRSAPNGGTPKSPG